MTDPRTRPAFDAGEREQLLGWFQLQRDIAVWKCAGLSDSAAHRVVLPSSPLMTMAGIISHLRWTEAMWFEVAFLGLDPSGNPAFDEADNSDFLVGSSRPITTLVDDYEAQCRRSDEIIAGASLDDRGQGTLFASASATLRWMVTHMVEETARHVGHLDLIRELLDGEVGYY